MGLSRNKGINFPLLTIYNNLNIDTKIIENKFNIEVDRAFINRYKIDYHYDTVYIDFDDTLIIKEKVNSVETELDETGESTVFSCIFTDVMKI